MVHSSEFQQRGDLVIVPSLGTRIAPASPCSFYLRPPSWVNTPLSSSGLSAALDCFSGSLFPLSHRRFDRNSRGCVGNTVAANITSLRNTFSADTFCVIRKLLSSEVMSLSCSHLHPGCDAFPGQFPDRPNSFSSTRFRNSANTTGSTSLSGCCSGSHTLLNGIFYD